MIQDLAECLVWKVEEGELDYAPGVSGWFFVDESEQFVGPYSSKQEAVDSLKSYAASL